MNPDKPRLEFQRNRRRHLDKIERHLAPMWETAPDPFGMREQ